MLVTDPNWNIRNVAGARPSGARSADPVHVREDELDGSPAAGSGAPECLGVRVPRPYST